ncbi:MAG: RES family NAD+ phosphorylase [Bryobacterales bacterium]|nr:RES family NAD+ phosphorylase [Bryobacterales bacterium]
MTVVYSILRRSYAKNPLDGEGALRYGGRWSSIGTRLAYTAERLSLAIVEYFVHLDPNDPPNDLVVATAEVPRGVSRKTVSPADLPGNWRQTPAPPEQALIGDRFVREHRAAVLIVPSALAPSESNWLINPTHREFPQIRLRPLEVFACDARFFRN